MVMQNVDTGFAALLETARMHKTAAFSKSAEASAATCNKRDKAMAVLLQHKSENMGVPCEEMCKRLGVYPDGCQGGSLAAQVREHGSPMRRDVQEVGCLP